MTKGQILSFITDIGIVPVVRTSSVESALKAVEAIYNGGIRAAEITMTVPGAIRALEKAADAFGDRLVLGAGTVLDPETARACMLAGAEFFVSPNLKLATIEMAKRYSKVVMPGALTPTEVLTAWEAGADIVKVFPSDVTGPGYLKALLGPLPQVRLMPTGGVNLKTAADFLRAGACALGMGGALADPKAIAARDFGKIESVARQFVEIVKGVRGEGTV